MKHLILTHNLYALSSLVTLTLGSVFIANHLYDRLFYKFNMQQMDANLLIDFLIVLLGSLIVSWPSLLNVPIKIQIICAIIGIMIGYLCIKIESFIITSFKKQHNSNSSKIYKNNPISINAILNKTKNDVHHKINQPSYYSIVLVGCCEEIQYRGFLSILCMDMLSLGPCIIALLAITFCFSLNHLNFGSIHVFTKAILGITCLISFIITKTIITPILIHATFNAFVIKKYRELAYVY